MKFAGRKRLGKREQKWVQRALDRYLAMVQGRTIAQLEQRGPLGRSSG